MASAQGSQYVKPSRGLVKLDLIWLESNQTKLKIKPAWSGLVCSGLPEFCLNSNNSAYNGYNSASLPMP